MKTYFTSDLHFGHKNILKYTDRHKVVSEKEHDEWLINIWNSTVSEEDTIYHLGDFSFHRVPEKLVNIMSELNGKIVMIRGNHDSSDQWKEYKKMQDVTCVDYKEIRILGNKTILFHFPIEIWNLQHHGSWHLHGHSHGSFVKDKGYILDVGIDSAYNIYGEHRFFTEQDIADYMQTRVQSGKIDHHDER